MMKYKSRRGLSLLLAVLLALTLAIPAWAREPETSALTLSQTSATLLVGEKLLLTAALSDPPAQEVVSGEASFSPQKKPAVQWFSSDPGVASVSQQGEVTALAGGRADIAALLSDGEESAVCTVTVEENYTVEVSIEPPSPGTLSAGESMTLSASVACMYDGAPVAVTWTSSDSGVASVDNSGKVLARSEGKAVLTATAVLPGRDGTPVSDVFKLTVLPAKNEPGEDTLVLTPAEETVTVAPGDSLTLTAPAAAVQNGGRDVSESYTLLYQWYDDSTAYPDGNTLTLTPTESGTVTCRVTAVGRQDEGRILTAQREYTVEVSGQSAQEVTGTPLEPGFFLACQSDGISLACLLEALSTADDPIISMTFAPPAHGQLLRDFSFGSGVPDLGSRYYTVNAEDGEYPLASLNYVPRAGFNGTELLSVTARTEGGRDMETTVPLSVLSKLDSDFFSDVTNRDAGAWCADSVDFAVLCGLVNGTDPGLFSPEESMSRCMLVTILYRMEGSPETLQTVPCRDVDKAGYYYDAVCWAASMGIVQGDEFGNFCPDAPLTREQLAVILCRYADSKGESTSYTHTLAGFRDASAVSSYAINGMAWAVERGIITGTENTALAPQESASRAQVVVMLHRYLTLCPHVDGSETLESLT